AWSGPGRWGLPLLTLLREGDEDRGLAIAADLPNPRHPVRTVIVVLVGILPYVDRFPLPANSGRGPRSFGLQNNLNLTVGRDLHDKATTRSRLDPLDSVHS